MTDGLPGGSAEPPGPGWVELPGPVLELMEVHAASHEGLTPGEVAADLISAGMMALYGPAGFPRSWLNPDGYTPGELAHQVTGRPQPGSSAAHRGSPELASSESSELAALRLRAFEVDGAAGFMVSMLSEGGYAGPVIDNRFFSFPELPPDGLSPADFWAVVLREAGRFLAAG